MCERERKKRTRQFGGKGLIFKTQGGERAEDFFFKYSFKHPHQPRPRSENKTKSVVVRLMMGDFWTPPEK
jgi:hypothetical protein